MAYIVTTSFYEGNTLHEQGTIFEHEDKAYIEKCLADGNIKVEGSEGATTAPDGFPQAPAQPETKQEAVQSQPPLENVNPKPEDQTATEVQITQDLENLEGKSETPSNDPPVIQ